MPKKKSRPKAKRPAKAGAHSAKAAAPGPRVLTSLVGADDLATQEQRDTYAEQIADEILALVDADRKEQGLPPLK